MGNTSLIPPTVGKDVGLVEGAAVGLMLGLSVGLPVGIICRLMEHVLATASRMSSRDLKGHVPSDLAWGPRWAPSAHTHDNTTRQEWPELGPMDSWD